MEQKKQIFQAAGPGRWKRIIWTGRFLLFSFLALLIVLLITLYIGSLPGLPNLSSKSKAFANAIRTSNPLVLKNRQNVKYNGFKNFLMKRLKEDSLKKSITHRQLKNQNLIRAAFYVPWDPASLHDLILHGEKLTMIFPEWFFVKNSSGDIDSRIDSTALAFMRKYGLKILPMLSNFNTPKKEFDGKIVHKIFSNKKNEDALIAKVVQLLKKNHFDGINVDFEELNEKSDESFVAFENKLRIALSKAGLLLTTDVPVDNEDYNYERLGELNDFVVVMAYDEFNNSTHAGPISSQKWIEQTMSEISDKISPEKIILGVAGYGGDWANGKYVGSISYDDALNTANEVGGDVTFDDDSYNLHYDYTETNDDGDEVKHQLWFTDAATTFNVLRFSDEFPFAGSSLWRLGTEDNRIWQFYNRDLSDSSLTKQPFDFTTLFTLPRGTEVKFLGEGEVLDIIKDPQPGLVSIELDSTGLLIAEENYVQMPSGYVIRKFAEDTTRGPGHKLILTFDDGPSEEWTPKILSVLEREHVPAAFFVVGLQAEQNIPILKREYDDGFEIGNHTFTHHNIAEMSRHRAALEMQLTRLLIESVTGHSTILFRAPYNADSQPETFEELDPIEQSRQQNYLTINEGIDPNDWAPGVSADSIVARVIRSVEVDNASIILLHDAGGETREATVEALPRIIDYFKKKGYVFTSVAGLMGKTRNDLMPSVTNSRDRWTNRFNFLLAESTFWTGKTLFMLFFIAIVLSILRIGIMILLASIQKRRDKNRITANPGPPFGEGVSILIPGFNEEVNCIRTVQSMLQQDYPLFEVVFVDDGSSDHTFERISNAFKDDNRVKIFSKENGGKASALNFGLSRASYNFIVCVDADTQLKSDALSQLMRKFEKDKVGAVAGNVKVGNEVNMLTRWQSIEYITSQNFDRRAFDLLNCITVIPGAIGAFKKEAIIKAGGFTTDTLAEDCDLTMRLLINGYVVRNCAEAISYTEAPETVRQFFKQRFRWSFGVMQCFWKHRKTLFNPKYGNFGLIAMPNILIFQIILTVLAPLADLILLVSIILSATQIIVLSVPHILIYYLIFTAIDILGAALAFAFEKENPKKLLWIFPQRLVYRQMMYFILLKSIKRAFKGELQHWGSMVRTGNVDSGSVSRA